MNVLFIRSKGSCLTRNFTHRAKVGHHPGDDGITRDVRCCTETIHEPINGKNEGKSVWGAGGIEDGVICCNNKNQTGALWNVC